MHIIGVILLGFVGLYFLALMTASLLPSESVAERLVFGVAVGSAIILIIGLVGGPIVAWLGCLP